MVGFRGGAFWFEADETVAIHTDLPAHAEDHIILQRDWAFPKTSLEDNAVGKKPQALSSGSYQAKLSHAVISVYSFCWC